MRMSSTELPARAAVATSKQKMQRIGAPDHREVVFRLGLVGDTQYCDESDFTLSEMEWKIEDGKRDSMRYPVHRTRHYRYSLQVLERAVAKFNEVGCACSVILGDLIDKRARQKGQTELEKCRKKFFETIEKGVGAGASTSISCDDSGEIGSKGSSSSADGGGGGLLGSCSSIENFNNNKWLYVFGNNDADLLNISDLAREEWIEHFVPAEVKRNQRIDVTKIYFDYSPVKGYRVIVLDCFEINPSAGTTKENRDKAVGLLNDNCFIMHEGYKHTLWNYFDKDQTDKRHSDQKPGPFGDKDWDNLYGAIALQLGTRAMAFQKYNGGISNEQIAWLDGVLDSAEKSGEIVVVFGHLPIHPLSARADGMLYNFEDLMSCFKRHNDCVKAYVAGHDHDGGYAVEDGVHYIVAPAPLNCDPLKSENDFGYLEFFADKSGMRLVWEGNGPNPRLYTIPPYRNVVEGESLLSGWPTDFIPF